MGLDGFLGSDLGSTKIALDLAMLKHCYVMLTVLFNAVEIHKLVMPTLISQCIRCCSSVLQIRLLRANKREFAFCLGVFASVSCAGASVTSLGQWESHELCPVPQGAEETSFYKAEQ